MFLVAVYCCLCAYEASRPVEHFNVSVVVRRGDCLQDIICDLQEEYGDKRDWRRIAYEICKSHGITKFIYPGQKLVVPLEVKR